MCTAFVKRGNDLLVGFNFDLDESAFQYEIRAGREMFYICIRLGATLYKTHGVNRNGNSGNLPYMNAPGVGAFRRGAAFTRLDLLNDRYIAGKYTYADVYETVRTKTLVNVPGMSMHTQFSDADGHILIVEPGVGYREVADGDSIITNYSVLNPPADLSNPFYGADRCETGRALLSAGGADFSVRDGLNLLAATTQTGQWATRVSYVYSQKENAVYYVRQRDFDNVQHHAFGG